MNNSTEAKIAEAQAAIVGIRKALRRHTRMLTDAKRDGESPETLREIEVLVENDHAFITIWERTIEDEKHKATDPVLIALRERVNKMSFLDCVALICSNEKTQHVWIPPNTPEGVARIRETVFEQVRAGILSL